MTMDNLLMISYIPYIELYYFNLSQYKFYDFIIKQLYMDYKLKKPLTENFYQKLLKLISISNQGYDVVKWNEFGNGIIMKNENILQKILEDTMSIHLKTFKKMLKVYGFRKRETNSGMNYIHYSLLNEKLSKIQSEFPENEQRNINKLRIKQQQQISIEQKIKNHEIIETSILQFTKNLKQSNQKRENITKTLKQRCIANDKILDTIMFKLLTKDIQNPVEKQAIILNINKIKDSLKRNEDDLNTTLNFLEKSFKQQQQMTMTFKKEDQKQKNEQSLHYLTQPLIQSSQNLKFNINNSNYFK